MKILITPKINPDLDGLVHDMFLAKTGAIKANLRKTLKGDFKDIEISQKKVGISQLEVVQLKELVDERIDEILATLDELKAEHGLDFAFLTSVDLEENFNLFVTADPEGKELLEKSFELEFDGNVARKDGLLLRKEIIPVIRHYQEN